MDFPDLLDTLATVKDRQAWIALSSRSEGPPSAAVLRGRIGAVEQGEAVFLPVDPDHPAALRGRLGLHLSSADFEDADGSLPGELRIRLRRFHVQVQTQ